MRSKKVLNRDIMKMIRWHNLCRSGQSSHIATIELGRMQSPDMHRHDFFECFLILEGEGQQLHPNGEDALKPDQMYFVRPEHAHCIRGQRKLLFLNIAFEVTVAERALELAGLPPQCWQAGGSITSWTLDRRQADAVTCAAAEISSDPSRCGAAWLLLDIARNLSGLGKLAHTPDTRLPDWLAEGLAKSGEGGVLTGGLPALFRIMGRSPKHVTRSFHRYLGQTPGEWLREERVRRACLLLSTTRLSVLEISLDCGFESPSYFHKCFRTVTGTTPLHYRKDRSRVQI